MAKLTSAQRAKLPTSSYPVPPVKAAAPVENAGALTPAAASRIRVKAQMLLGGKK